MKDCKFCDKTGLLILPLRYAAVADEDAAKLVPALPGTLGQNVQDIGLTHGRYAPRLLREGYLYALIQREGIKYWEGYVVTEDAFLYKFPVDNPPKAKVEFSCDQATCGIDASCISVPKVEKVDKMYLLFTPSAMTTAKLDEYKAQADAFVGKGKMQVFDPKGWAKSGNRSQTHSLKPELLDQHVPEWLLYKQGVHAIASPLGRAMNQQLFPAISAAYAGVLAPAPDQPSPGRLGVLQHKLKKLKGACFAVFDHIGITQELNDFRNASLEGIEHYLAATDQYGASNQQRLQVYEAIHDIKAGMEAGVVMATQEFIDQHGAHSDAYFERQRNMARKLRSMGREDDAKKLEADVERGIATRNANYARALEESKASAAANWKRKYESRLDVNEMQTFYSTLQSHLSKAFAKANARTEQHLKWFESDRLVNAFDTYDAKDAASGYGFALHSAVCTYGISGCKTADAKLDAWIKGSPTDRKNLYLRGVFHNQDDVISAAKQAADDMRAAAGEVEVASDISPGLAIKATKGLVDGFKKIDSAFDEWVRYQGQDFSRKWAGGREIVLYHKMSEMTRTVFRSGLGGTLDKNLVACISGWLYARLRAVATDLAYNEVMLTLPKEKVVAHRRARAERRAEQRRADKGTSKATKIASQVDGSLEQLIADAQQKAKQSPSLASLKGSGSPPTNNYHQVRMGVVLGCIEMIALGEKLTHAELSWTSGLEIGGSAFAVGSILLDTQYSAAKSIREIQPYKGVNAIQKGADIVRGGFKLGAGVLGAGAGVCGTLLDFIKLGNEEDGNLRLIYGARAASGAFSIWFSAKAAFSYSESLLHHIAKGYAANSKQSRWLLARAVTAKRLAERVGLLVWVARLNWIGLALTAAEIGYLLVKDDDLQNWCEKSVFRLKKTSKGWLGTPLKTDQFEGAAKELEALQRAAQMVGVGS